jgi:hypothetical protein
VPAGGGAVAILHPDKDELRRAFWMLAGGIGFSLRVLTTSSTRRPASWSVPLLQFARAAAFTVIVPVEPVGVVALGALMLSRRMPHKVYRLSSRGWPNARPALMRLISFVLLALMIVSALDPSILLTWSALALLLWNGFEARRDIYAVLTSTRSLDQFSPTRAN